MLSHRKRLIHVDRDMAMNPSVTVALGRCRYSALTRPRKHVFCNRSKGRTKKTIWDATHLRGPHIMVHCLPKMRLWITPQESCSLALRSTDWFTTCDQLGALMCAKLSSYEYNYIYIYIYICMYVFMCVYMSITLSCLCFRPTGTTRCVRISFAGPTAAGARGMVARRTI